MIFLKEKIFSLSHQEKGQIMNNTMNKTLMYNDCSFSLIFKTTKMQFLKLAQNLLLLFKIIFSYFKMFTNLSVNNKYLSKLITIYLSMYQLDYCILFIF